MAASGNKNPWLDDSETSSGYGNSRAVGGGGTNPFGGGKDPFLDEDDEFSAPMSPYEQLQHQKQMTMNRQLQGTDRAMASIYDSERMGITTAEELVHQGEQLDNVEKKLDGINTNLKTSQRHLTGIKSVFGSITNWWKGAPREEPPSEPDRRRPETTLSTTLEASAMAPGMPAASKTDHPGLRGNRGQYDEESREAREQKQKQQYSDSRKQYEQQLDSNLDGMSAGLARLKNLGLGLGEEISAQNEQVDRITNKTDRADITIKDQNRQIRGVLGK